MPSEDIETTDTMRSEVVDAQETATDTADSESQVDMGDSPEDGGTSQDTDGSDGLRLDATDDTELALDGGDTRLDAVDDTDVSDQVDTGPTCLLEGSACTENEACCLGCCDRGLCAAHGCECSGFGGVCEDSLDCCPDADLFCHPTQRRCVTP